jgi:hypothetical protein
VPENYRFLPSEIRIGFQTIVFSFETIVLARRKSRLPSGKSHSFERHRVFGNSCICISGQFDVSIIGERRIRHFDDK